MSKLSIGGHSFGGMTAIGSTNRDSRIKACIPIDPWFLSYAYKKEYETLKFTTPYFSVQSETWYEWNQKEGFDCKTPCESFIK